MFFGIEGYYDESIKETNFLKDEFLRTFLNADKFKNEREAQLSALPVALEKWIIENNCQIDFLVISGNIAAYAITAEYNVFMKYIMEQLLPLINLPKQRIILCPGVSDFSKEGKFAAYSRMCNDLGITPLTHLASDENDLNLQHSYFCGYRVFTNVAKLPVTFVVFDSVSNRKNGKASLHDEDSILKMHNTINRKRLYEGIVFSIFHDVVDKITDLSDTNYEGKSRKKYLERMTSAIITGHTGHDSASGYFKIKEKVAQFTGGKILDDRNDTVSRFDIIRVDTDVYKCWCIVGKYVDCEWVIEFDEQTPNKEKGAEFKHSFVRKNKMGDVATDSEDAAKVAVQIDKVVLGIEIEQDSQVETVEKEKVSLKENEKSPLQNKESTTLTFKG